MNRNIVFFSSFNGLYNDNPKYISEELHRRYPKVKIVWLIAERANKHDLPSYITEVRNGTIKYVYYKNRAKNLIDNYAGMKYRFVTKYRIRDYFLKKARQYNYSTWHGTPLKKIGRSFIYKDYLFVSSSTTFVLNSEYIKNIFQIDFSNKIPVKLTGSPRNDILFKKRDEELLCYYKRKLGLMTDKKIIIYAPTYRSRNTKLDQGYYSVYLSSEDVRRCLDALKQRFGGDWCFVYRVHQHVINNVLFEGNNVEIVNGNLHDDMAEYLFVSDALITDYSGSLFDYTITKRPCFLYAPDYEKYKDESRGIYLEITHLPYPVAYNSDDLVKIIGMYDEVETRDKINQFNNKIGLVDNGNAAAQIVDLMDEKTPFKI